MVARRVWPWPWLGMCCAEFGSIVFWDPNGVGVGWCFSTACLAEPNPRGPWHRESVHRHHRPQIDIRNRDKSRKNRHQIPGAEAR